MTRRASRPRLVVEAPDGIATEPPAEFAAVAIEHLPDLAPEALEVPGLPGDVPVVVETAASVVDATPASLDTAPLAVPARRSHERCEASVDAAEVSSPSVFAMPAASEDLPAPAASDDFSMPAASKDLPAPAASDDFSMPGPSEPFAMPSSEESARQFVDEFEAAARLFSFTGETPVQVAATAIAEEEAHTAPAESRRRFGFRRVAAASFSVGVVGVVGLLTVGMTTPLEAVAAARGSAAPITTIAQWAGDVEASEDDDIQAYVAPAQVQNESVDRTDEYETATFSQLAAESGIANFSNFFVNDPDSPIQWPFAVGVPITYGFGMRSGTMHEGIDFVPGAGSPVQAIADGTVRIATESGGAFGVTVLIDHIIDGELISSRYGHMQYGSLQVETGEQVTVGTFIGRTGNTGRSFGAHTHFELLAGGTTPIDPLPWLREHAGG